MLKNVEPAAGFHDLRRTFGARLALAGVPMAVIAHVLGYRRRTENDGMNREMKAENG